MGNVLMILADDMRYDELYYMPNTRRLLGGAGTNFNWCRTNCAVCGPTRTGLITGQLSKHHGVTTGPGVPNTTQLNGSMHVALNATHRVGHIGKYPSLVSPTPVRAGFDYWRVLDPTPTTPPTEQIYNAYDYEVYDGTSGVTPGVYQDHYLANLAIGFVQGTEPWFLQYCPTSNHWPWHDPPNHTTDHSLTNFPITLETDVSDKPTWVQARAAVDSIVLAETQIDQRHRLRELLALDDAVGALVATIQATEQADNTTVLFTSDNGMHLGEHRVIGGSAGFRAITKNTLYDPSLRAPLLARGQWFDRAVVSVPTMQQDIVATVHELTNTSPTLPNQAGISLLDIASNPSAYVNRRLLHYRDGADALAFPSADAVTTSNRKLIRHQGQSDPDKFEMYDLDTDPHELVNVAYVGGRLAERDTLEGYLNTLLA